GTGLNPPLPHDLPPGHTSIISSHQATFPLLPISICHPVVDNEANVFSPLSPSPSATSPLQHYILTPKTLSLLNPTTLCPYCASAARAATSHQQHQILLPLPLYASPQVWTMWEALDTKTPQLALALGGFGHTPDTTSLHDDGVGHVEHIGRKQQAGARQQWVAREQGSEAKESTWRSLASTTAGRPTPFAIRLAMELPLPLRADKYPRLASLPLSIAHRTRHSMPAQGEPADLPVSSPTSHSPTHPPPVPGLQLIPPRPPLLLLPPLPARPHRSSCQPSARRAASEGSAAGEEGGEGGAKGGQQGSRAAGQQRRASWTVEVASIAPATTLHKGPTSPWFRSILSTPPHRAHSASTVEVAVSPLPPHSTRAHSPSGAGQSLQAPLALPTLH
ncbi:unnamed protein product, partial [Closterium sp. Naga37s-1]